jgi:hypothetical protein
MGGLLSSHFLASDTRFGMVDVSYNDELLKLALDLGQRLLPAFDSTATGIPHARVCHNLSSFQLIKIKVNLVYGLPPNDRNQVRSNLLCTLKH